MSSGIFEKLFNKNKNHDRITAVYLNCEHEDPEKNFRYSLSEKDGETLYSAFFQDENGKVIMESKKVSPEIMESFNQLADETDLVKCIKRERRKEKFRNKKNLYYAAEVKFSDGYVLSARKNFVEPKIKAFFDDLA